MTKRHNFCGSSDHAVNRRMFLGSTATAAAGMAGLNVLAEPALAETLQSNGKRVIMLWLAGGASQLETFDPKPGRPTGGPFGDIQTDVSGIRISELMPKMAQRIGKYTSIIRSLNTRNGSHGGGAQLMLRGRTDEPNLKYPEIGAMLAKELGRPDSGVPDFVHVYSQTEGRGNAVPDPGFLGARYDGISLHEKMGLDHVVAANGISDVDHREREDLRRLLSEKFARGRGNNTVNSHNEAYARVRGLMSSDKLFDVEQEPAKVRERYGKSMFGQQAIVARRLCEAGVPFVRIGRAWWDSHGQNFETHLELVPELDHVMSTLLDDLDERGLLEDTLVVTLAEFGRTPKINASLGRDHFASAWSCSLSGTGVKHGCVYGETDKDGNTVKDGEIGAGELFATIFEALGIPHHKDYFVGSRPIPLVNPGISPVEEVLA